jgi:hypothetical protein
VACRVLFLISTFLRLWFWCQETGEGGGVGV